MNNSRTFAAVAACLATLATVAAAAPAAAQTPGSDRRFAATENRDARQDARIGANIDTGRINNREAARLGVSQNRIDRTQSRLSADGNFSRRDYARVSQMQDRASTGITRKARNQR